MIRFYCTICKKVKRARKYPRIIESQHSASPTNRIGECNFHARLIRSGNARQLTGVK
jgi:hypothetical protein